MRRKRLGMDVDEVMFDFITPGLAIAKQVTGRTITPHDYEVWDMFTIFSAEEKAAIFAELEKPGFCRSLQPIPGAIEAVRELRKMVDVYPVTSHFHSLTWVAERDASLMETFHFERRQIIHTSSKFLVATDAFLDDNPSHVKEWSEEHPLGLAMLWHIPNTRTMTQFDPLRVKTWEEVLKRVEEIL